MSIYEIIDGVLGSLDVPFYDTMPTFAENNEPPLYIVYSLYDTPDFYGDGEIISKKYIVTVNIIGNNVQSVDELQGNVSELLQENNFLYAGCNYQIDADFPKQYRRIIDFSYYQSE